MQFAVVDLASAGGYVKQFAKMYTGRQRNPLRWHRSRITCPYPDKQLAHYTKSSSSLHGSMMSISAQGEVSGKQPVEGHNSAPLLP